MAGVPEVRKAVVERHAADFATNYTVDECVFTTGGKLAIFNAVEVLIEHGDEVIVPVPFWVSYKDIIEFCGGKAVFVESLEADNFRVTAQMIEAAITPRTKAIFLNFPSNPSGAVIPQEDMFGIVALLRTSSASTSCSMSATSTSTTPGRSTPAPRSPRPKSTSSSSARFPRPTP